MSEAEVAVVKKKEEAGDDSSKNEVHSQIPVDDLKDDNPMPSSQEEEHVIKKKYGGMMPKKPPLISKDHERAYFDSADWALGKQGAQKPKGPLEALRPKLQVKCIGMFSFLCLYEQLCCKCAKCLMQLTLMGDSPTQQHARSRRSPYAPADDSEGEGGSSNISAEEDNGTEDVGGDAPQDQSPR
ncbi:hypothetical protein ACSQ67_005794 [Phaseolus vulgaris]